MIQGDPNQNFRFQMTVALSVCISDPMLVKQKCVWEVVVFYEFQLIFYTCKSLMPKMTTFFIKHHGLMDKALVCHAKGPWFKSYPGYKRFLYFWRYFVFFYFFKILFFAIKNYRFSNTFWLYHYWVRNAHRQSYTHLKSEILIWVTLYKPLLGKAF